MKTANWYNVYDTNNNLWLAEDFTFSRRHSDAEEFHEQAEAIAAAKECLRHNPSLSLVVFGDFDEVEE